MNREFGFYFKELLLALKKPLPALALGIVFVIILLIVIFITRKMTDRRWLKEPEKLEKAIKIKIRMYIEEIKRLKRINSNLYNKNKELRNLLRSALSLLSGVKSDDYY